MLLVPLSLCWNYQGRLGLRLVLLRACWSVCLCLRVCVCGLGCEVLPNAAGIVAGLAVVVPGVTGVVADADGIVAGAELLVL
jgi:hypothetical protein